MDSMTLFCLALFHVSYGIPLEEFYKFGEVTKDGQLEPANDFNTSITRGVRFPFFQTRRASLIINNNGIIFITRSQKFYRRDYPKSQYIAPFHADIDTRENGTIWYTDLKQNEDIHNSNRARKDIKKYFCQEEFEPTFVFVVTWMKVPHSNIISKTATFQCVLVSDGTHSFVLFLYADGLIEWISGVNDGELAVAAINHGQGESLSVPSSGTRSIINITKTSNVEVDGVWAFKVAGGDSECAKGLLFQLKFKINTLCTTWINDSFSIKYAAIASEVTKLLTSKCNCILSDNKTVSSGRFFCFKDSPVHVTYRAKLKGNGEVPTLDLISYLEEWVSSGAVINIGDQKLHISSCRVAIATMSEPECHVEWSQKLRVTSIVLVVIGVVFIFMGTAAILSIVIVVKAAVRKCNVKKNSQRITLLIRSSSSSNIQLSDYMNADHREQMESYNYVPIENYKKIGKERVNAVHDEYSYTQCEAYEWDVRHDHTSPGAEFLKIQPDIAH